MNDTIITRFVAFYSTVSIVGTIGNLIVSFVYWKKNDKQTSTFFILVLALIDLTVCSIYLPLTIYLESILHKTDNLLICKSFHFLTTSLVPASVLLMTAIAFDRYFCICMVSRKVMTLSRAKLIVIILLTISILYGVVPSLCSTLVPLSPNNDNETLNNSLYFTKFDDKYYQCNFDMEKTGLLLQNFKYFYDFVYLFSVIVITVLYVLIYKEIYTRRKIKRNRKRELMMNSRLNGKTHFKANEIDLKKELAKKKDLVKPKLNEIKIEKSPLMHTIEENDKNGNIYKSENIHNDDAKLNEEFEEDDLNADNKNDYLNLKPITKPVITDKKKSMTGSIKSSFLRRHSLNYTKQMISKKDIRTAFMLFVISFLFISSYTPPMIATYISLLKQEENTPKPAIETNLESTIATTVNPPESDSYEHIFMHYLYFCNSAINPIIYCFLNPNFRKDLIKLFFRRGFIYSKCTKVTNLN